MFIPLGTKYHPTPIVASFAFIAAFIGMKIMGFSSLSWLWTIMIPIIIDATVNLTIFAIAHCNCRSKKEKK